MQVIEPPCPIPPQEQVLRHFSFSDREVYWSVLLLQHWRLILYLTPAHSVHPPSFIYHINFPTKRHRINPSTSPNQPKKPDPLSSISPSPHLSSLYKTIPTATFSSETNTQDAYTWRLAGAKVVLLTIWHVVCDFVSWSPAHEPLELLGKFVLFILERKRMWERGRGKLMTRTGMTTKEKGYSPNHRLSPRKPLTPHRQGSNSTRFLNLILL
jgi:hypothetical protein